MKLESRIRHCLFLNWALPAETLPPPPEPLRYEIHSYDGTSFAFLSALLFRQEGAHVEAMPLLRLSFPQLNLRYYVVDDEGVPSVYFLRTFVPSWALLPVQFVARQPASRARFAFTRPSTLGPWEWLVRGPGSLHCRAEPSSPSTGAGPSLGSWQATVEHLRQRNRGYVCTGRGLRRTQTEQPSVEVVPVRVQLFETGLLQHCVAGGSWPELHSAFLCPELPLSLELGQEGQLALSRQAAVPG